MGVGKIITDDYIGKFQKIKVRAIVGVISAWKMKKIEELKDGKMEGFWK